MGKKLLAIIALVVCMTFALVACGEGKDIKLSADNSGVVTEANGGFLAETADYIYFINGNELYTEDNTKGSVEKGALVRMKKSDLKSGEGKAEVVVSKLLSTSDYSAGIYIYGDRIYFATPSAEEDKVGTVQNNDIKFCYAKLSGEGVTEFATAKGSAGNGAAYRFVEVDGKVYVVFLSSETVEEDGSDVTKNYINVVESNGDKKAKVDYESYIFDNNASGKYVYYTKSVKNEVLGSTESFNEVYRLKIGAAAGEKLLYGAGSNRNTQDGKDYQNKGVQGVKFTLVAAENGYVYLSVVNLDTSVSTNTFYAYLAEDVDAADPEAVYAGLNVMTRKGDANVFAATSMFHAPDCIVYLDSAAGLYCYNYTKEDSYYGNYGKTLVYDSTTFRTATLGEVKGGYLYYNISGVQYKIAYNNGVVAEDAEEIKLSPVTFDTAWYAPEVITVDGTDYVIGTVSSADYHDYIMAYEYLDEDALDAKMKDNATEYEAAKAIIDEKITDKDDKEDALKSLDTTTVSSFLTGAARANVYYNWKYNMISVVTGDALTAVTDYFDSTYPDGEVEEEEEEGCSSMAGAGLAMGVVLIGLGAIALKKRG